MKKNNSIEDNVIEFDNSAYIDAMQILNKMLELEKVRKKNDPIKITICVVGGIVSVLFMGLICYSLIKDNFSLEGVLSTIIAFFSIFISIFFYFKADETSKKFYDSSYDFMKDVSVTLGKIEERFGEKLNSLNDKFSHFYLEKEAKKEELQNIQEEKQDVIKELLDKAKLNEAEKEEYLAKFREKEEEADTLRKQLRMIDTRYRRLMRERDSLNFESRRPSMSSNILTPKERSQLAHWSIEDWPNTLKRKMFGLGYLDSDGELTAKGEILLEGFRDNSLLSGDA